MGHRLLALLAPAVAAAAAAAASSSSASPGQSPSPSPPPPPPAVIPLTRVDVGPIFGFGPIYTLAFSVGTPPQAVRLAVDSWSSDIWVATPRSLGNSTVPHRAFDPALSASFRARNVSSHLPYPHAGSNGSSVDVDVGEDVGDLENAGAGVGAAPGGPPNPLARLGVVLGVASREDAFFLENPAFDGMMGLALDQGAQLDAWGALSRLANESGVPFVFGLFLAQPSGAAPANGSASDGASSGLAVGAPDARRFADPLAEPVFSPVLAREGTGGAVFDVWRFALPHMQLTVQRRAHAFAEVEEAGAGDAAAAAAAAVAADEPDAPGAPLSFCGPGDAAAGCVALLDLSRDTIAFPGSTYSRILAAVNASAHGHCVFAPPPAPPGTVLCPSLLATMPNITFTISGVADPLVARPGVVGRGAGAGVGAGVGKGRGRSKKPLSYWDLEMMPADYCEPAFVPGNHSLAKVSACRLLFSALGEYRGGRHPYASAAALRTPPSPTAAPPATEPSVLLLGAPFLRAFYSVYDGRVAGGALVGFVAASSTASVLPSAWRPPAPPPPGGGSALPSWLGSKEMWAGVVGVGVGFVITGGLVVVLRDRCRERQSRRNARQMREELLFGFDESGSIMIEDRDLDDDDEHEDGFGFDDDESLAASGLSASVSMPGGSSGGAAATSAPPSPSAAPPAPAVAGAGGSAAGAAAIDVLRLDVGGLVGATARGYRDLQ